MQAINKQQVSINLCTQLMRREQHLKHDALHYQTTIYRDRLNVAVNLYQRNVHGHFGCVNALEFSNGGIWLASGGDDKRVLIWNVEKMISDIGTPRVLSGEHSSNIFCLGFDSSNKFCFSGGNDEIMIKHDFETGRTLNVFSHESPIYGLTVDKTTDNLVSTATEEGKILLFDLRQPVDEPLEIATYRSPYNAVEFHPLNGNYLLSANTRHGVTLWDIRCFDHPLMEYNHNDDTPNCMNVRFNSNGKLILALHRRLPPILFRTNAVEPVCTFYHNNYFNSCTMKSCTFAGPDDELVLSGSDDFNLYGWRLNDVDLEGTEQWIDEADFTLYGHRSIVNQVRYNRQRCIIASSGVEKIIKLWSPFEQKDWTGDLLKKPLLPPKTRNLYNIHALSHMSPEFSNRTTVEDQHMLAFFDSLVQRDLDDSEDDDSDNTSSTELQQAVGNESDIETEAEAVVEADGEANEDEDEIDPEIEAEAVAYAEDDDFDDDAEYGEAEADADGGIDADAENELEGDVETEAGAVASETSWHGYPNRIRYLIARKRKALLRLAIKNSTIQGNLPHRVKSKLPLISRQVEEENDNIRSPSPTVPTDRSLLYSSPTRMHNWLTGFEVYNTELVRNASTSVNAVMADATATDSVANGGGAAAVNNISRDSYNVATNNDISRNAPALIDSSSSSKCDEDEQDISPLINGVQLEGNSSNFNGSFGYTQRKRRYGGNNNFAKLRRIADNSGVTDGVVNPNDILPQAKNAEKSVDESEIQSGLEPMADLNEEAPTTSASCRRQRAKKQQQQQIISGTASKENNNIETNNNSNTETNNNLNNNNNGVCADTTKRCQPANRK